MPTPEKLAVGVDLGGTKVLAGVVDPRGRMLSRDYGATPAAQGSEAVVRALVDAVRRAIAEAGLQPSQVSGVGIAAAGVCDPRAGILRSSPHLPGMRDVPLRDIVQRETGLHTVLENDANAAAVGELHFGAGRGALDFIYVTLSTGIGGGIVVNGKLYSGASGAAGEVGHMTIDVNGPRCDCGRTGCWEALASGTALAAQATKRIREGAKTSILDHAAGDILKVDARAIHAAALAGDGLATELITTTGYYVGIGFANLINLLNPEMIIIGGGLANLGEMLLAPARRVAGERSFPTAYRAVRFVPAQLGDTSAVLGAAALAIEG